MEPARRKAVTSGPADAGGEPSESDPPLEPDPAGIGPDGGTTFTVYFPADDGYRGADLAHPAPLPRIGDQVEYIDEAGVSHRYRVRNVMHTFQAAPPTRPTVREAAATDGEGTAGTTAGSAAQANEVPRSIPESAELRGGLPEVFLESVDEPG